MSTDCSEQLLSLLQIFRNINIIFGLLIRSPLAFKQFSIKTSLRLHFFVTQFIRSFATQNDLGSCEHFERNILVELSICQSSTD